MRNIKTIKKKRSGRDASGQVSVRHQGGEHKKFLRNIDFKRNKFDVSGKVISIEYDPNRTANIALIQYADGEKRYMLAPDGLSINDKIISSKNADIKIGNSTLLKNLPIGTFVHNIELVPGKGGQIARGAGTYAIIAAKEEPFVHLKLPSGEIRVVRSEGMATIGNLSNIDWKNEVFGTAGRKRRMGIRPTVRGVAQNPRSHPHGGGEGRSGIGMTSPKTYAGRKAYGKTRKKKKYSNKYILKRRGR
ncbi:MAG: 50S ribosomal protein L2 [Candidatus Levybacteria bacterium GW2011_GWA2_40_8]|nr:MAG: 50S ribosomal protein L2 [Candidatus Levybacteria bacterium GW2011_GWA2_40_8]